MKEIKVSDNFYNYVMDLKKSDDESFEEILKRMLYIRDFNAAENKKIVLIGNAGVGKSTIRECFFAYNNPKQLIEKSLEPTRGVEFYNYPFFELNCTILDTSGQEIRTWLTDQQEEVFSETDFVIYVVEAEEFQNSTKDVYDLLKEVAITAKLYSPDAIISIFIHKVDLIAQESYESFKKYAVQEHRVFEIAEEEDIPMFLTSIKSPYVKWLNIAFLKLLRINNLLLPNYREFLNKI